MRQRTTSWRSFNSSETETETNNIEENTNTAKETKVKLVYPDDEHQRGTRLGIFPVLSGTLSRR